MKFGMNTKELDKEMGHFRNVSKYEKLGVRPVTQMATETNTNINRHYSGYEKTEIN